MPKNCWHNYWTSTKCVYSSPHLGTIERIPIDDVNPSAIGRG